MSDSDFDPCNPPIRKLIDQQGFYVCNFTRTDSLPAFSYSIGLTESTRHPELIVMGLSFELNASLIASACEEVVEGRHYENAKEYSNFLEGYAVQFLPVLKDFYSHYFGFGIEHYGGMNFDALQIVWPSKNSAWPWDEDCEENMAFSQKLLDRDADFHFLAPKNLGVFVDQSAIGGGKPIIDVEHADDGDWCFMTEDPATSDNMILVCLEEVVKSDPTVNQLAMMEYGFRATRRYPSDQWDKEEIPAGE